MNCADTHPALERPFADGLLAIHVSPDLSDFPFSDFADALANSYQGRILQRLGAPWIDEVYWDIQVGDHCLTLHGQHFLGVYLCATSRESEILLEGCLPFVLEYVEGRRQPASFWIRRVWRRVRSAFRNE